MKSSPVIQRHPANPLLTYKDVPYDCALVFNAGVCKYEGKYVMVFRNDYGSDQERWEKGERLTGTNLGLAFSDDGVKWEVQPEPCWSWKDDDIRRAYDPRLTVIDGQVHMCFAVDSNHGVRGGIARTDDFQNFEVLSLSAPDNRNMVLFPEKVNGKYCRFERPMPVYGRGGRDRFDMWYSDSPDLAYWGNNQLVIGVENFPPANDKVGPGAPPVKTEKGWLNTFHSVDLDTERGKNGWENKWQKRYCSGIMLTDLNEPWKVIGMSREPLLAPETDYEAANGFRNDVIFPGGMILEDSGEVKMYYGGADTVECLATAHVDDLIKLCLEGGPL
ncbi:glycoside hydrolase family 130 protein [Kiritimatiellaeota bacterium B1221]|nr:glycoside hydrolase family 130 protein [Kiritimatiellaeota bacterium B1221]